MSWRESLPEDIRESEALKDIEDVGSLAKQFIDQGKFLGSSIRVPGEDATDEARAEFRQKLLDKATGLVEIPADFDDEEAMAAVYKTLGRPDDIEGYELPEVEGAPVDKDRVAAIAAAAHKAGISKRQFKNVMSEIMAADAAVVSETTTAQKAALDTLRDEWGSAFDGKLAKASKLAELTKAPAGLVKAIGEGKVDAATLQWLDALGASIGGETSEILNQQGGDDGAMTKAEARERAQEILERLDTIPQSDPRYNELLNKRVEYMKIAAA